LLKLYNTVFPVFRNRAMFVIAIGIDLAVALLCIRFRGRNLADYAIISFILLMLWYRVAMHLTNPGGYTCACMGILTVIFNLTPYQEAVAAYATLVLLAFCAVPGLKTRFQSAGRAALPVVTLLLVMVTSVSAQTFEVHGQYDYLHFNPAHGTPNTNRAGIHRGEHFYYSVLLRGEAWRISVTNRQDAGLWSQSAFDGTNIYYVTPSTGPFLGQNRATSNGVYIAIDHSKTPLYSGSDWAYAWIPWLAYGLNPARVQPDASGLQPIPLPWQTPRLKLRAYGWNWKLIPSSDKRFVASCEVIRDTRLDLTTASDELLRPEFDYPVSIADKNTMLSSLDYRRGIANEFVDTQYRCMEWFETNGMKIPRRAEISQFLYLNRFPLARATLVAEKFSLLPDSTAILGWGELFRDVDDFRYKQRREKRLFPVAQYKLKEGEAWKGPKEADIRAKVEDHLKRGSRYDQYDLKRRIWVWVLGVALLATPFAFGLIAKKTKQTKR